MTRIREHKIAKATAVAAHAYAMRACECVETAYRKDAIWFSGMDGKGII